ncbi:glycoside hydrolase family 31 protein [Rubellicoccus peritrichatus]|uniref:Glycoside hydrolase family 31 protein n=1 Tax=Rubellicoccus peritrichatus TaxID=3080537 RepID=A0AAQ3LD85_9BACT|nr:glycoside hydrolase family 31 protein [Puniceicoccus sp. CR14]WOO43580.1 glycoside hydrolase family 31 protein [Puniceicoccus sp. CR14]
MSRQIFSISDSEGWWGGNTASGHLMPFTKGSAYEVNLMGDNEGNQSQPILLSSDGRLAYCDEPVRLKFGEDELRMDGDLAQVQTMDSGKTLRDAYLNAKDALYEFDGRIPDAELFRMPQYNTWIELMYDQNEVAILAYAERLLAEGYPPGVLMIDDTWQEGYGIWEFAPRRFKNPKEMIARLHAMGFKVMLWVCPFIQSDSPIYRQLAKQKAMIRDAEDDTAVLWGFCDENPMIVRWWNGASGVLDLTHPEGLQWFRGELDRLVEEYGVDGFKLDAGDANFYLGSIKCYDQRAHANKHMEAFARLALDYPLSELRACWKLGGAPIAQRLRDKWHTWEHLQQLIPQMMTMGLLGYPFACPDMIGGGDYQSFLSLDTIDQELFVRSAQCSALMPMMQFSAAPWRILDEQHASLCLEAAKLHAKWADQFESMALDCARIGEPILRPLEYNYPHQGYLEVKDQFMLGDSVLVAPVVESGAYQRKVHFPTGRWQSQSGEVIEGPCHQVVESPLDCLSYYTKRN